MICDEVANHLTSISSQQSAMPVNVWEGDVGAEGTVALKRLIIEMGMGIDQHGQEPTVAAARAVRNAIAHNALPGVWEVAGLSDPNEMVVEVQISVPYPEQVQADEVLAVLPFGRKTLKVESGGMVVQGRAIASLNDKNDEMLIAVAAVTVWVEVPEASL
jgi:uncharacterized protein (TIGR02058 family)